MSWFGFGDSIPANDYDAGRWAVTQFHNRSTYYSQYTLTLDQLLTQVGGKHKDIFLQGLGEAIHMAEMDSYQVQDAMEKLADKGAGRIPADQGVFFEALYDRVGSLTARDWLNEAPSIIGDSAIKVAEGGAAIGNAAIDLGKSLTQFGPLIIFGAIVFIVYARTRQIAGR